MKNFKYILFFFLASLSMFSQNLLPNNKSSESLIGKINYQIENGNITDLAKIYLNNNEIELKELTVLNEFELESFTSLEFCNIKDAIVKFGEKGKNGVVYIVPFADDKLKIEYYKGIINKVVLDKIKLLTDQKLINSNPILVLNGIPLIGEEIETKINELKGDSIKTIYLLAKDKGYKIFGIRAANGVLIITTI